LLFLRKLPALKNLVRPVYVRMGIIPEVAAGIQTASEPVAEAREVTIIDAYREKNDN
jgi:hypothetical protein